MSIYLYVIGAINFAQLRTALAAVAGVPVAEVDVRAGDVVDRYWEAAVLCTYEPVLGDVTWCLDLYFSRSEPDEAQVAAKVAATLDVPVLYDAQSFPPSADWLVLPDGSRTRARVYEGDDPDLDIMELTIDAVEKPVPTLPHVRVAAQPEVIKEHRMPTPVTDDLDLVPPLRYAFGGWESMVARMTAGWPPDGWYPRDYFEDDLAARDELAGLPDRFAQALDRIDQAYLAATRELADSAAEPRWWRRRVPDPLPWPGDAAR
ncbi:hypothetical protein [Actinoplanes sp. NBRC 101535]|uniref:hypothetical protein n=1 Tax=Actinoplanes sp. NBRC 101535 TaxID=3032196 RepID=UPI0024A3C021|nr:hypothetical protein [Actinoplanes sp. NBRC 101535]GLY06935.1 hypothetical protein Acsp01_73140 [Actinoplanes sp. NBRC 101535]